jgi:hypothetical protein
LEGKLEGSNPIPHPIETWGRVCSSLVPPLMKTWYVIQVFCSSLDMRHEVKAIYHKDNATRLWKKVIQLRSQLRMSMNV